VSSDALQFSLQRVGRDGAQASVAAHEWHGRGNTASRVVAAGVTERVTATNGTVEWDLVLRNRPGGAGPFHVDATVRGARAIAQGAHSLRITGRDGAVFELGELVVVDAQQREHDRALPTVDGTHLRLDVPARVLDTAADPSSDSVAPRI
jgi:hypothetical protein